MRIDVVDVHINVDIDAEVDDHVDGDGDVTLVWSQKSSGQDRTSNPIYFETKPSWRGIIRPNQTTPDQCTLGLVY